MALSRNQIHVEVKPFRGEPRVYIRNSNKKIAQKSLNIDEWNALKNSSSLIEEQLPKLKLKNESQSLEITQKNMERNDPSTDDSDLCTGYPSSVDQNSQCALKMSTPSYNTDEAQRVVAELLAIIQAENELNQGFHLSGKPS